MAISGSKLQMMAQGRHMIQDPLKKAQDLAINSIENQSFRLRIISENLANANSLPTKPGESPYQRKIVMMKHTNKGDHGRESIGIKGVTRDRTPFKQEYNPGHPAADEQGMVLKPNVESVVEVADMISTQQAHKDAAKVYEAVTKIRYQNIDLLK